jgi:glycerol-3-phosphate dehydrogenase
LLLEQHDLGKGTSSRSTKLIHGGVRYLRQGDISLVREALRERGILFKNAPHVVRKQEFVIPCYSTRQRWFYGIGLKAYDLLAGKYAIGRSRFLSPQEVIDRLPNIGKGGLKGGVLYYDGQFDDTRLLIDLALTAQQHGAAILNYARVTSFVFDDVNRLAGLVFQDVESGETHLVKARAVINASGIFTDSVRKLSAPDIETVLTFSQGIHLVFDNKFLSAGSALMVPTTSDGRVLFCIPWHGRLLVGTTDTPVDSPELEPESIESEIDFVLQTIGQYLDPCPTRDDILSVFAGIRPLVKPVRPATTSSISRGHDLLVDASGMITITGGKWTTYRKMAEDTVDRAISVGKLPDRGCVTAVTPIRGSHRAEADEDLLTGVPCSRENVIHAVRNEFARTVEDVLARRTRVLFLDAKGAVAIAEAVANVMASELGRDDAWVREQVEDLKQTASLYKPH